MILVAGAWCASTSRAAEPPELPRELARACAALNAKADITLAKEAGKWRVADMALWAVFRKDSSLDELARLGPVDSLRIIVKAGVTADGIAKLSALKLRTLAVSGEPGPEALCALGKLETLEGLTLDGCRNVTDKVLARLEDLPKLKRLSLCSIDMDGSSVRIIARMKGLTDLNLCDNKGIGDGDIAALKSMAKLQVLDLSGTAVGPGGVFRDGWPALESLTLQRKWSSLARGEVWDKVDLSCLPKLTCLDISGLSPASVREIVLPDGLRRLAVQDNMLGHKSFEKCRALRKVEHLALLSGHWSDPDVDWVDPDRGFESLLTDFPSLKELDLGVTHRILNGKALTSLCSLRLAPCGGLQDEGARKDAVLHAASPKTMPKLESLDLSIYELSRGAFSALVSPPRLRHLRLSSVPDTSADLVDDIARLDGLRILAVSFRKTGRQRLSGDALGGKLAAMESLEELTIKGVTLSDDGLKNLAKLKKLRLLDITGVIGFTDGELMLLMQELKELQSVKYSR